MHSAIPTTLFKGCMPIKNFGEFEKKGITNNLRNFLLNTLINSCFTFLAQRKSGINLVIYTSYWQCEGFANRLTNKA